MNVVNGPFDDYDYAGEEQKFYEVAGAVAKQQKWEERVVKSILNAKSISHQGLLRDHFDKTGKWELTFDGFRKHYPNFPIFLFCRKIPNVHKITIEQLYKRPLNNIIYKNYAETRLGMDEDCGLVFEWLHSGGQMKIMHNHHWVKFGGPSFSYEDDDIFYKIENFTDFLNNCGWVQ
jgi:hypothetical protein